MKKALVFLPLILFCSCCFGAAVICKPAYVPTGDFTFEDLSDMPVKLQVTDYRTEKFFFKHMWAKYWDPDTGKKQKNQPVKLEKTPKQIVEENLLIVLNEYGYMVKDDAPTTIEVNLTKFLYTVEGDPTFANIELNVAIQNSQRVFARRNFDEYTEKELDAFHQYQDAEPVLSICLSRILEKLAADKAIPDAIKKSYGKNVAVEDTRPPSQAETRTGTGFAVAEDGLIVTAYHVIKDAKSIKVFYSKDSFVSATVVHGDPVNDLATLRISKLTPDFLQLTPMWSVKMGDKVFTIGFPVNSLLGREAKYTEGVVSALSGLEDAPSFLQTTVPIQPGNSGGALVSEKGEVVGVITSTAAILPFVKETGALPQNINWAVKVDYLRPLLKLPKAEQKEFSSRDELIEHVKKSTFFIETN